MILITKLEALELLLNCPLGIPPDEWAEIRSMALFSGRFNLNDRYYEIVPQNTSVSHLNKPQAFADVKKREA